MTAKKARVIYKIYISLLRMTDSEEVKTKPVINCLPTKVTNKLSTAYVSLLRADVPSKGGNDC